MKLLRALVAAALFCAPATVWGAASQTNTIDYSGTGDTVKEGVQKLDDEVDLIYGHINNVDKHNYGAVAPSSPDTGDVWTDTSSGSPVQKYWTGAAWAQLGATGAWATGLGQDAGLADYSKNMMLRWSSSTTLTIVASAADPATVMAGDELLQNTANTSVDFTGAADDVYDVYAVQSGATTNFTLGRAAAPYAVGTDERVIGRAYFNGAGLVWAISYEFYEPFVYRDAYLLTYVEAADGVQSISDTTWTSVNFTTETWDPAEAFSTATFTPPVTGWYEVSGAVSFHTASSYSCSARLYNTASAAVIGKSGLFSGNASIPCVATLAPRPVYLGMADTIQLQVWQSSGGAKSVQNPTANTSFFTARYIGRKM